VYEDEWRHRVGTARETSAAGSQTWGWGFAGISHFFGGRADRGWTYINHSRVADYFNALDAGRFPIERGFHYLDEADFRLTVLFQMVISMGVDRALYASISDLDVVDEFAEVWGALVEVGWATVTPERVQLIGDGVFYTPLIQSLLAHDRVVELRTGMGARAL
jgi:oxygen-independent coproporphyrinogen-3 oxidase